MLTVCTFKWFDPKYRWNDRFIYGAEHVNRLHRGIRRNLSLPHRFVCVTDDGTGLDSGIEVVPIWQDAAEHGGCYRRLRAFGADIAEVLGDRFVWLDLDCVITGSLDALFARTEPLVLWSNGVSTAPYCGSMVMMDAGAAPWVWEEFDYEDCLQSKWATGYVGTDQAWFSALLGPDMPTWTRKDGVYSWRHLPSAKAPAAAARRRYGVDAGGLPDDARIVFFHGVVDPSEPAMRRRFPWIEDHWI